MRCSRSRATNTRTPTRDWCSPTRRDRRSAHASVDAIFAAGLLTHVPDPHDLLRTLRGGTVPAAGSAIFHPIGRATLAARHTLRPGELLDPTILASVLTATGWVLEHVDDGDERYLGVGPGIGPAAAPACR